MHLIKKEMQKFSKMKPLIVIPFKNLKKHYDKILVRKYLEISDVFEKKMSDKNLIIYKVYIKDYGDFKSGLTVINPGKIGREYFMTKGHRHKKISPEIYILISGKGKILINEKGKERLIKMKRNIFYHIPGKSGHRLINTGNSPLEVLTIYGKNVGHDYKFKFKKVKNE